MQPRNPDRDRTKKDTEEEMKRMQEKQKNLPEKKPKILLTPPAENTFLSSLTFDSLQKLRRVVKRNYMTGWPSHLYTDYEADRIIEAIAPGCVEKMMAQGLGQGLIERNVMVSNHG